MKKAALLFSGYNQRAIVALCRYFVYIGQDFVIVASGRDDSIYRTAYAKNVIFERSSKTLGVDIFRNVANLSASPLVYCPTSEFLNQFVLEHATDVENVGVARGMPQTAAYATLTSKKSSQEILKTVKGVSIPREISAPNVSAPCIIKPNKNITGGKVLYPIICEDTAKLENEIKKIDANEYFFQEYISGQSYYICGYINKAGEYSFYWQENLLQQPGGKSIVLARTCANPGLEVCRLFNAIKSVGYYGPIMAEFIKKEDAFYYIELNPRFWGPLQLGIDCCSDFLSLYAKEWFDKRNFVKLGKRRDEDVYYSWYLGAQRPNLNVYPAAKKLTNLKQKIECYDVYKRPDTIRLYKIS